jgi:hypothetical protein
MPSSSSSSRISAGFRPFAGLQLAAGKFPQAGQRLAFRPLCDQHAAVGIDQRAGDDEEEFHVASQFPERTTLTGSVSWPVMATVS